MTKFSGKIGLICSKWGTFYNNSIISHMPKILLYSWLENLHGLAASLSFELMCRTASYHLSHLILLYEVVQYKGYVPFLKKNIVMANNVGLVQLE